VLIVKWSILREPAKVPTAKTYAEKQGRRGWADGSGPTALPSAQKQGRGRVAAPGRPSAAPVPTAWPSAQHPSWSNGR
jgi:hypothetical protein